MRKPKGAGAVKKQAKVPKVGLFFMLGGKAWVEGVAWTENPSIGGFRTYALGHPEYWTRLQQSGAVPKDMPYEDAPRGRVNFEDASGRLQRKLA